MPYEIHILKSAQRSLAKIAAREQERIIRAIRALAKDPRPKGAVKLSGREAWRIRVGDYRVIYEIHDKTLTVTVIALGPRATIYRKPPP